MDNNQLSEMSFSAHPINFKFKTPKSCLMFLVILCASPFCQLFGYFCYKYASSDRKPLEDGLVQNV